MNFIPLSQATAGVMSVIGTATDEDRNLFNFWVYEVIKLIGPNTSWVQECRLECEDNSLRKPDGLWKTIDIALYTSTNQEVPYTYHPNSNGRIHITREYTNLTSEGLVGRVHLSDDSYYFNISDPSNQVSYANVRYLAIPTDGNGELLIPDVYSVPIMMFCRWMWSLRKNDNRSEIDQNYSMWLRESDRLRGRMKMPSQLEAAAIGASWMNMFAGKLKSQW